jgi:hypothetical protein
VETRTFEAPEFPAYSKQADSSVEVTPKKLPTGRVVFDVTGQNLDALLDQFYRNPEVNLLDFLKELRTLRAAIFNLKSGAR